MTTNRQPDNRTGQSDNLSDGVVLRVRGLTVAYPPPRGERPVAAVTGVDLDIRAGEIVALIGESGSGKTTIINAIFGLLPPEATVRAEHTAIDGRSVDTRQRRQMRSVRGRLVGLVPQDPTVALDPVQRVGAQVAEALAIHRAVPRDQRGERVLELLADAGLPEPGRVVLCYPHELSGGMRQRVLIAIALACRPPLLVADEPTSALDVVVQRRLLDHLAGLATQRGIGMLLVTHDLALAAERADRVVVLRAGRIVESGAASAVFAAPRHAYTRSLLAAQPRPVRAADTGSGEKEAAEPARPPVTSEAAELVAAGVSRVFPGRRRGEPVVALDRVDLEVRRGETHGLVGESGSGKSTLARLLLRLDAPSAGSVHFDGVDVTARRGRELRDFRRRVQLIAQNPFAAIDPRYTAADAIAEPLRAFGLATGDAGRRRVAELAEQVALPRALLTRRARELSGGQCQRIAIARALAAEPDIVVCDEVVSALDVTVQAQILRLLADLQRELGAGYLFITHDLAVVADFAARMSVMRRGRIVETGAVADVTARPRHPYTRELLGSAPRPLPAARSTEERTPPR